MVHARDGSPEWALLVCDVDDDSRCYARVADAAALVELEGNECVDRRVDVHTEDGNVNVARL